ncbi:MAG: ubiquinone/menaquinone biosynthesis C-methylase UbiE [Phycisphaerales bacterium]|jgi:ubiquinone/menaquinone biosynthesis C-methylase UbiE
MPQSFNAEKYKSTTHDQWQDAAEAWDRWGPLLRSWLGPSTQRMLDVAGVGPGSSVLDVAAGAGDQTLLAAERVGPTGRVLATDLSSNILGFALHNAKQAGLENVETLVADGENLPVEPESFDAVISRVGLIYFPDQHAAVSSMHKALKPGGKCAAITYSTGDKNGFFSVPVSIIRKRANLPAPLPGQPGPFSLGDPAACEALFTGAGFTDVQTEVIDAPVRVPTALECLNFEKESFGALHQLMGGLSEAERASVWEEIEAALNKYQTPEGFVGPCELVLVVGTK